MRRWSTRWPHPRRALVLALAAAQLPVLACVSRSVHEQTVAALQADKAELEERVRDLERSNAALGEERVALLDEMEDLREARDTLDRDVAKLQRSKSITHLNLPMAPLRSSSRSGVWAISSTTSESSAKRVALTFQASLSLTSPEILSAIGVPSG